MRLKELKKMLAVNIIINECIRIGNSSFERCWKGNWNSEDVSNEKKVADNDDGSKINSGNPGALLINCRVNVSSSGEYCGWMKMGAQTVTVTISLEKDHKLRVPRQPSASESNSFQLSQVIA